MSDKSKLEAFIARRAALQRRAAKKGDLSAGFLHERAAHMIGERLAATNRQFKNPALLFDGIHADMMLAGIRESRVPVSGEWRSIAWPKRVETSEVELIDVEPESLDLVVSVFDLQRVWDLSAILFQVQAALKPDGLFIGCIPAAETLSQVHRALLEAEAHETEGAAQRIEAFREAREMGDLMQRTGFKLVVTDIEEERVSYSSLYRLAADLRSCAATSMASATVPPLRKAVVKRAEATLRAQPANERFTVTARIAHFSGWKHAETQQQPLKPGAARVSLKDVL